MSETDGDRFEGTRITVCGDCGAVLANRGGHRCTSTQREWLTSKPNRRVIAVMTEFDDNPTDATVVHTSGRFSRAYHATDDGEKPRHLRCSAALENKQSVWTPTTRRAAQRDKRFPCTQCHDLDLEAIEAVLRERGLIL